MKVKKFLLLALSIVMLVGASISVSAANKYSDELISLTNDSDFEITLVDGTASYSTKIQEQVFNNAETIFDLWIADDKADISLDAVIVVPVTGTLAYDELNDAYKGNLAAVKKQYTDRPDAFKYAVRYVIKYNGATYNAMCFMGADDDGRPYVTEIELFNPKSDAYILAMYTLMYPTVPALVQNY